MSDGEEKNYRGHRFRFWLGWMMDFLLFFFFVLDDV